MLCLSTKAIKMNLKAKLYKILLLWAPCDANRWQLATARHEDGNIDFTTSDIDFPWHDLRTNWGKECSQRMTRIAFFGFFCLHTHNFTPLNLRVLSTLATEITVNTYSRMIVIDFTVTNTIFFVKIKKPSNSRVAFFFHNWKINWDGCGKNKWCCGSFGLYN